MRPLLSLTTAAAILACAVTPAAAQDRAGEDPADLPRYPGTEIRAYRAPSLDEILMPTAAVTDAESPAQAARLEGEVTHIDYRIKPAIAPLGIERHYAAGLAEAGYTTVFRCAGEAQCGRDMGNLILNSGKISPVGFNDGLFSDRMRVIVARRDGDWVLVHMIDGPDRSLVYLAKVTGGR